MKLTLRRFATTDDSTMGTLSVNGEGECFTLEDTYREVKINGITRIPEGYYKIDLRSEGSKTLSYQNKFPDFHHGMIWIRNVPNFDWIYIHIGNEPEDTEGCILVGSTLDMNNKDFTGNSTDAYKKLYDKVATAMLNDEEVFIEII